MVRFVFFFLFGLVASSAIGQSLDRQFIGSTGEAVQNTSGGLSYSVGEVVTASSINVSVKLTQGFQQIEDEDDASTVLLNHSELAVFPNPVKDRIFVDGVEGNAFEYQILDAHGKLVSSGNSFNNNAIDVSVLTAASYQIRVFDDNSNEISIARFIKIQ